MKILRTMITATAVLASASCGASEDPMTQSPVPLVTDVIVGEVIADWELNQVVCEFPDVARQEVAFAYFTAADPADPIVTPAEFLEAWDAALKIVCPS